MINRQLAAGIGENQEVNEQLTGYNCPICGYPIVLEGDLEVCYQCGWFKDEEETGYYEE